VQASGPAHFVYDTCNAIEIFSKRHGGQWILPALIWQESRFDPNASATPKRARHCRRSIPSPRGCAG